MIGLQADHELSECGILLLKINNTHNNQTSSVMDNFKYQILQLSQIITQKCDLDFSTITVETLQLRYWYSRVLETLFPHLANALKNVMLIEKEQKAIEALIKIINDLDQFQFIKVNESKIVEGDLKEIRLFVGIMFSLLEIVIEEYEDGDQGDQELKQIKNRVISIANVQGTGSPSGAKTERKIQTDEQEFIFGPKKRKLVTHPDIPQTLKKAKSADEKALTKIVKQNIKSTHKKMKKQAMQTRATSPIEQEIQRKKKQCDFKIDEYQLQKQQRQRKRTNKRSLYQTNQLKLGHLLKWREEKLKQEKQDHEQAMRNRIQSKKQLYVKKINNLIVELEKQRQKEDRKEAKQKLLKTNADTIRRLEAIEQSYKNELDLLKQKERQRQDQRHQIRSGYKQKVWQIEKILKRQNNAKIAKITHKYQNQQHQIETDYEQLKNQIIKSYKKN